MQCLEHFSSTPILPSPHLQGVGGGGGVGDRYVFGFFFFANFGIFSLYTYPTPPLHPTWEEGEGVGDIYVFGWFFLQILEHLSSRPILPLSLPPYPREGGWGRVGGGRR